MSSTILIIGATGVFGRKLAAHLARTKDFHLVLSSRSRERAEHLVKDIAALADTRSVLTPVELNAPIGVEAALRQTRPTLVVDCSGPFQALNYATPFAVAAAGAHFVDLADARDYILGFERALDDHFRSKGLVALAGASSSPALGASVVAALTEGWRRVDDIDIAIVPGGQSEVGEAAIAAALSYCGRGVPIIDDRKLSEAIGWGELRSLVVTGLGRRVVAPVETADAELLHVLYPSAARIRLWAGLESWLERRGLWLLAGLRRRGVLRQLSGIAALLARIRKMTRLTTGATGGMRVRVVGIDQRGRWTQAHWHLIARENHGPHVPPSPAAAAVRAILRGEVAHGARPALALPLAAIEAEFESYAIETHREMQLADCCFVENAIGAGDFDHLATAVREFHQLSSPTCWAGRADIDTATDPMGRLAARVIGLPSAGRDVPVSVQVERETGPSGQGAPIEKWTRCFATRRFVSEIGSSNAGTTTERFPPFTFQLGLRVRQGRLYFPVTGWRIGPLRLPASWAPRSEACEWQDEKGRFNFDVHLSHPMLGVIAYYRGWLVPVSKQSSEKIESH